MVGPATVSDEEVFAIKLQRNDSNLMACLLL